MLRIEMKDTFTNDSPYTICYGCANEEEAKREMERYYNLMTDKTRYKLSFTEMSRSEIEYYKKMKEKA